MLKAIKRISKEDIVFLFNTVILAFWSVNWLRFSYEDYLIWGFLNIVIYVLFFRKNMMDGKAVLLLVGMVSYAVIYDYYYEADPQIMKMTAILPCMFYLMGKMFVDEQGGLFGKDSRVKILVLTLAFGTFVHGVLNAGVYFQVNQGETRHWPDYFGGLTTPATQHSFYFVMIGGLLFWAIYFIRKQVIVSIVTILSCFFSIYFTWETGSRLNVAAVLCVLILDIGIFLYSKIKKHKLKKKIGLYIFFGIGLCVLFIFLIVGLNIGNIKESHIYYMVAVRDGGIFNNIRFKAQFDAIRQLLVYPYGGKHMELHGLVFAHNVWLDMANDVGLFSFIILCVYTVVTCLDLKKLMREKKENFYLLMSVSVSLILYFMVEPALNADFKFLLPWFMVNGMIKSILH